MLVLVFYYCILLLFLPQVGRLALTEDNSAAKVPCGEEAVEGVVPLTRCVVVVVVGIV